MARRNLLNYVMDVYREVKRQVDTGQIRQAIQDYIGAIDQKAYWLFLLAEANLRLEAPYSVGTVDLADNSTAVVGNGTAWSTGWQFKRLQVGNYMEMPVASFASGVAATLVNTFNGPATLTQQPYTIFQSSYLLPSACEPGRDDSIKGQDGWGINGDGIIHKKPRQYHEHMRWEVPRGSCPLWYTDDGVDATTNRPKILIYPWPQEAQTVRVVYFQRLPIPATDAEYIMIPESFERLIVAGASALVMRRARMQDWMVMEKEAGMMLNDLYNRYAASQAYDLALEPDDGTMAGAGERRSFDSLGRIINP